MDPIVLTRAPGLPHPVSFDNINIGHGVIKYPGFTPQLQLRRQLTSVELDKNGPIIIDVYDIPLETGCTCSS